MKLLDGSEKLKIRSRCGDWSAPIFRRTCNYRRIKSSGPPSISLLGPMARHPGWPPRRQTNLRPNPIRAEGLKTRPSRIRCAVTGECPNCLGFRFHRRQRSLTQNQRHRLISCGAQTPSPSTSAQGPTMFRMSAKPTPFRGVFTEKNDSLRRGWPNHRLV
jgi:hypothetical protein